MKKAFRQFLVLLIIASFGWSTPFAVGAGYSTSLPVVEVSSQKQRPKFKLKLPFFNLFKGRNADRRQHEREPETPENSTIGGACSRLSSLVKPRRTADRRSRSRTSETTQPQFPANFQVNVSHQVLARSNGPANSQMHIDIGEQRAYLIVDGQVGLEMPVSTARAGHYTPRGTFTVTERVRHGKISTLYHVEMPYWQRLNSTVFGIHAGYLPGTPASAGCVRLPLEGAEIAFDHMSRGMKVTIHDSWAPERQVATRR